MPTAILNCAIKGMIMITIIVVSIVGKLYNDILEP